jgi:COMPASS component SWD2
MTYTLKIHQPLLAVYDPSATVIAIALASDQSILLYDIRNFNMPPVSDFDL